MSKLYLKTALLTQKIPEKPQDTSYARKKNKIAHHKIALTRDFQLQKMSNIGTAKYSQKPAQPRAAESHKSKSLQR
jgi:hypothetical protein